MRIHLPLRRRSLTVLALLAALGAGSCFQRADHDGQDETEQGVRLHWEGHWSIGGTNHALCRGFDVREDGTYEAIIWQGHMTVDGCGGPFVGDGASRGTWNAAGRTLHFYPEEESSELLVSFHGTRAECRDGDTVLVVPGDPPSEFPLTIASESARSALPLTPYRSRTESERR